MNRGGAGRDAYGIVLSERSFPNSKLRTIIGYSKLEDGLWPGGRRRRDVYIRKNK